VLSIHVPSQSLVAESSYEPPRLLAAVLGF